MADDLLPANKTPLEAALSVTMRDAVYGDELGIRGLKYEPVEQIRQFLIWEYGLEELRPYISDDRLLEEGIAFQRIRGTTAAIQQAMGWLGYPNAIVEQEIVGRHSAEIQINPGQALSPEEARRVADVFELAKPARARLSRIYYGFDRRRFKLDRRPLAGYGPDETLPESLRFGSVLSGGDLLSADSGVALWPGGPLLSFARSTTVRYTIDPLSQEVAANLYRVQTIRCIAANTFRLSWDYLDEWLPETENRWAAIHVHRDLDADAAAYGLWMEASWETVDQSWQGVQIVTRPAKVTRYVAPAVWDGGATTWDGGATVWDDYDETI